MNQSPVRAPKFEAARVLDLQDTQTSLLIKPIESQDVVKVEAASFKQLAKANSKAMNSTA